MDQTLYAVLIGFLVGGLVGLTGLGGGVLMLPLLILGLRVPPLVAIGTDVVCSFFTKIFGAAVHWRRGNVDWRLVWLLARGSIPGAVMGLGVLAYLRAVLGDGVNDILHSLIGVLLLVIPLLMIVQGHSRQQGHGLRERLPRWVTRTRGALFAGLAGGALVGLTSVGSGSVIMLLLLLFLRRSPRMLVGTDIAHAVILMGVTGLGHLTLGTVDLRLVAALLVGSVPGVLVGSGLSGVFPAELLRRVLLVLLIVAGTYMV